MSAELYKYRGCGHLVLQCFKASEPTNIWPYLVNVFCTRSSQCGLAMTYFESHSNSYYFSRVVAPMFYYLGLGTAT